ncbi:MAG: cobalamin biosynthesis protein [Spongiibacteraceae bacterium]|nr:cobalamin biosynthesis protein [Spongiibacteraceae bacterium]
MIKIITLTQAGSTLGKKLCSALTQTGCEAELVTKPAAFTQSVQQLFQQGHSLIFIGAVAIAVRTLAPVLVNKYEDPPVLVLDEKGQFVIPLLSGHEGGANAMGDTVATLLNAQLVQTTAKPYLQPVYTVGLGCERDCPINILESLLTECLQKTGITVSDLYSINSIDIKADEQALIKLAQSLKKPFQTWSVDALRQVESQLSQRSEYVFNTVGVYGVAESAALVAAQDVTKDKAELILNKHKNTRATCAIARSYPLANDANY